MSAPDGGEQRLSPRIDEGSATTTVESGLAGWRASLRERSPQLRRGARTFLLFALAGSAINVGFAWACALWAYIPSEVLDSVKYRPGEEVRHKVPNWSDDLPEGFPKDPLSTMVYRRGVGVRYVTLTSYFPDDRYTSDFELYCLNVVYAGWPFDALRARAWTSDGSGVPPAPPILDGALIVNSHDAAAPFYNMERLLPFDVEWLGFVVNTIFYGGILYLIVRRPEAIRRFFRIRRVACAACGYPIGSSPVCTECGGS